MNTGKVPKINSQDSQINWVPANSPYFTVSGLYWFKENDGAYIRLPKRAENLVPPNVWALALNPSGGRVRFKTDSTSLKLRIWHGGGPIDMVHFCAVGCSGIDLYEGPPTKMTFWRSNRPADAINPYICTYFEKLPRVKREFTLYLPTYCNLASLEIGLDPDAKVAPPSPLRLEKPVAFYGTSITQGGCASRGGNGFVPRLGRMLGVDVINLGFSGSGKCEPEMAELFSEIDASCYVVDPVANMTPDLMKERYFNFVETLRNRRPDRPILLMTRIRYAHEAFEVNQSDMEATNSAVLEVYHQMQKHDTKIFYFDASSVIGLMQEHPTVDGVHPTDLGFKMLSDALAPVLADILNLK